MKKVFSYSEKEKSVSLASINLFFSALLGANLGTMNEVPLSEYFTMVLVLVGAVTAILMIAISQRHALLFRTVLVLLAVAILANLGADGTKREFLRLAITLTVWLGLLLLIRLTPFLRQDADNLDPAPDEV